MQLREQDPCQPCAGLDGGAESRDEHAVEDGCGAEEDGRAYDLCLWASELDLRRILRDPDARLEIQAAVTLAGRRYDDVELELHGGTSRTFDKKSYRFRFAGARPAFDFFGDGPETIERLVLQASWIDPSFVRAKLVFDVLRELGALAPRVGYARVFLNGEPLGLYLAIERVDEHFLRRNGLSRDGNLYKAENHAADFSARADPLAGFSERTHEDGRAEDLAALFTAVRETPLSGLEAELAGRLHLADFALWNQVMSFALNLDTFSKNYYLYHDPQAREADAGAVFRIIHWDADATFGLWWTGERYEHPLEAPLYGGRNVLAGKLYGESQAREPYLEEFARLIAEGPLTAETLWARADAILQDLQADIEADLALWRRDTRYAEERQFLEEILVLREQTMRQALAEAGEGPRDR